MKSINELTICRENYSSEEEFYNAMKTVIKFLINERYFVTVKNDCGPDIIVIEYDYADPEIASFYNYWLDYEEADLMNDIRTRAALEEDNNDMDDISLIED